MMKTFAVCMAFAVAIAVAGLSGASAGPLSGAHDALAVLKGYSTIEKTGCIFGTHRCKAGTKWSCVDKGSAKSCVCRPC